MRVTTITTAQARKMVKTVKAAPMLEIHGETTINVARVGVLPPLTHPEAYLQTTDGVWLRLPPELNNWAVDCVALAQTFHNPFPRAVTFGLDPENGAIWAELE